MSAKRITMVLGGCRTVAEARVASSEVFAVLDERGVEVEGVVWDGNFEKLPLPNDGRKLVRLSALGRVHWPAVVKRCVEFGHFPFYHNDLVDESGEQVKGVLRERLTAFLDAVEC